MLRISILFYTSPTYPLILTGFTCTRLKAMLLPIRHCFMIKVGVRLMAVFSLLLFDSFLPLLPVAIHSNMFTCDTTTGLGSALSWPILIKSCAYIIQFGAAVIFVTMVPLPSTGDGSWLDNLQKMIFQFRRTGIRGSPANCQKPGHQCDRYQS